MIYIILRKRKISGMIYRYVSPIATTTWYSTLKTSYISHYVLMLMQNHIICMDAFWYGFNKASCFSSMHSSMGLTKQVISPRCIMVWVRQSKSFLLDALWYGFDKARCFSSMYSSMGLTKQDVSPRCILVWVWQSKLFLLDVF